MEASINSKQKHQKMTSKSILSVLGTSIALACSASAATLSTATYAANTDVGNATQYFLESTSATWTINSSVTVTGGRYFIGSTAAPNTTPAIFTITGGGTLDITRSGTYNLRLGQNNASESGQVIIKGGSTLHVSGTTAGEFMHQSGGFIELDGVGSTFSYVNATTGTRAFTMDADSLGGSYSGQTLGTAIPFQLSSASEAAGLKLQYSSVGGVNYITAVPEPSSTALLGLGGLALILRRSR